MPKHGLNKKAQQASPPKTNMRPNRRMFFHLLRLTGRGQFTSLAQIGNQLLKLL